MDDAARLGDAIRGLVALLPAWNARIEVLETMSMNEVAMLRLVRDELLAALEPLAGLEVDLRTGAALAGTTERTMRRRLNGGVVPDRGRRHRPKVRVGDLVSIPTPPAPKPVFPLRNRRAAA